MADQAPRGRRSAYAYFIKEASENFKKEHPNEEIEFAVFSKKCEETWKQLSESEKLKFYQLADDDKKHSNAAPYRPPENIEDRPIERDPNLPDLPRSAYYYFCEEERDKVKAGLPADKKGIAIPKYITKELTARWVGLASAEKAKYEELAATDKIRYERDMATHRANLALLSED